MEYTSFSTSARCGVEIFKSHNLHLIHYILISHQRNIPHLFCPVGAAFGEAGFGKEVVVDILIREQLATLYEGF